MAERRMLSKKIIDSDLFMDMPQSTQVLYFHLLLRADDEGFLGNPKTIMRIIGCSEDDYKILLVKKFVISFPNGICVIKHWYVHNYIQKDRYTNTRYITERNTLGLDEDKIYKDFDAICVQDVYKV